MLFEDDDAAKLAGTSMRVPDGIIDGKQYAEIFRDLSGVLEKAHPGDYHANISWIMHCINECYEDNGNGVSEFSKSKAADVITALAYFSMTMSALLYDLEAKNGYFEHQNEVVIPQLMAECQTIPWYDLSDEVKKLTEQMEDSFDEDDGL